MMTNFLGPNIFKVSMLLMLVSGFIMALASKVRTIFKKNKLKAFVYLFSVVLLFALTALMAHKKVLNNDPLNSFIGMEIVVFLMGIGHIYVLRTLFKEWFQDKNEFFKEILFTVVILCVALLVFMNIVGRFKEEFTLYYLGVSVAFVLPTLALKMYELSALIPVPIYKKWTFPIGVELREPSQNELANPLVITFQLRKKYGDTTISRLRTKAPEDMEFGRLFFFFVEDYNQLHPEQKIQVQDKNNKPNGYIFYFKPNWWSPIQHIDTTKTVKWNGIREDCTIIVQQDNN